jgi:hypothetical protein
MLDVNRKKLLVFDLSSFEQFEKMVNIKWIE